MKLIALLRRQAAAGAPGESFAAYTALSSLLPSLAAGQDLAIGSGSKLLVDLQMLDAQPLGQISIAAGGELRFDPRVDTRLLAKGIDNSGLLRTNGDTGGATHPTKVTIHLYGPAPTVNGYTPSERTALGIGTGLIRGFTHSYDNVPTGNDGLKNDSGGVSRGLINEPGGTVRLFARQKPQYRRLNANWSSGTTLTLSAPLTSAAPVGAAVLITPTKRFNASQRTEEKTLAVTANVGDTTITVDSAPAYPHWGQLQYVTDAGVSLTPDPFTDGSSSSYTGSISGTTMTISAVVSGTITVGQRVQLAGGADVNATKTYVTALGTGTGGVGTYTVSVAQTLASTALRCIGMRADSAQDPVIDQRAFVAIMHSNIVLDAYSLGGNTDLANLGFGWHGMSMGLTSVTQIDGVLMKNYGQRGLLGRYAWHFHQPSYNANGTIRTDGVAGSTPFAQTAAPAGPNYPANAAFVRNCGFHKGFNRAFVFHACRGVVATDNIAYRSWGHSFFEEDGSEEDNVSERNLAIQATPPPWDTGTPLKMHEFGASLTQGGGDPNYGAAGHWFGNLRNRHVDNWAVDCEAHGWWNGTAVMYGAAGACTGFSANVPIYPNQTRFNSGAGDAWDGNSAFSCGQGGRSNINPINNRGDGSDAGPDPRDNDAPSGNPVQGVFKNIRFFKCGGGPLNRECYHNRVFTATYDHPKVADNYGPAFNGQAQIGSKNIGAIGLGYSLNAEATSHALYAASYHGLMQFKDGSFFNFASAAPVWTENTTLKRSCVMDSWDLYTDPLQPWSTYMTNWRMLNSAGIFQTPGPALINDVSTYDYVDGNHHVEDNGQEQTRWLLGIIYDHNGYMSEGPTKAGVKNSHIVWNQPFHMTGAAGSALEINPASIVSSNSFFGFNVYNVLTDFPYDVHNGHEDYGADKAMQWRRLDASLNPISGAVVNVRDAFFPDDVGNDGVRFMNASGYSVTPNHNELWGKYFNGARYAMWPSGGIVEMRYPGAGGAGKTAANYAYGRHFSGRFWRASSRINPNANDAADFAYFAFPIKGTDTISNVTHANNAYTAVASWAALQAAAASSHKYWFDTANNRLFVKLDGTINGADQQYSDVYSTFDIRSTA